MSFIQPTAVFIGLGANLPSQYGDPVASLIAALGLMQAGAVRILRSPWYESEPVPASDQPWYVNAVIAGSTLESADNLLQILHKIEQGFGRERNLANAARPLDLDLLAYGDVVTPQAAPAHGVAILPHPRMQDRAFVLQPFSDIAPNWRHPVLKASARELLARLGPTPGLRLARGSDAA